MLTFLKEKVRSLLTNPHLIGWGILFLEFWALMWIFVFTPGKAATWPLEAHRLNCAVAVSALTLLSMAAICVSLCYDFLFAAPSIRYVVRFTRLSAKSLIIADVLASLIVLAIAATVMLISVVGLSYLRFKVLPLPENVGMVYVDILLGSLFMYLFARFIVLTVLSVGATRSWMFANFIPLLLGFLAYAALWVDYGKLVPYIFPFLAIMLLIICHYSGVVPPSGGLIKWLIYRSGEQVNPTLLTLSLIVWMALLTLACMYLTRRVKAISVYDLVQIGK